MKSVLILGGDEVVGTELERILAFARRMAKHGDMGAEGVSKLYCHMAKAAEADHGKLVAGF
jgi:hypothetical protein